MPTTSRPVTKILKRLAFYQYVHAQIGVPYVWGGASPNGFDCSGLVEYAASKVGLQVPHYTVSQFNSLPAVTSPKQGDLVYFNIPGDKDPSGRASAQPAHVGVCADDGCSIMINAPQPGQRVQLAKVAGTGMIMGYRAITGENQEVNPGPQIAGYNPQQLIGQSAASTPIAGNSFTLCQSSSSIISFPGVGGIGKTSILNACQAKALTGGFIIVAGGLTMMFGLGLLAFRGAASSPTVQGFARAGLKGAALA